MTTLTQTLLLGTERTGSAPASPHPALDEAWRQMDWNHGREVALLEAAALAGTARCAGLVAPQIPSGAEAAPAETRPYAKPPAVAVLRRLFAEEWRPLLPEWMELCARNGALVPPFFLRTLCQLAVEPSERERVRRIAGERGRWLARLNPEWSWLLHGGESTAAPDAALWETGTPDERLAVITHLRRSDPAAARQLVEKTWGDEIPGFREQLIEIFRIGLDLSDEAFLTRALKDKRKDVRLGAQALLATLAQSGLSARMRHRADALLACTRGFLGRKLEVALPAAFESDWTADALETKPPAGTGEKAFWTQQILALVPLSHWVARFELDPTKLIELAAKSGDWADLLLGAWYRSTCLHRDAEASAALIPVILARQKPPVPGVPAPNAAANLLAHCAEARRWQVVAETAELAWAALPMLDGTPKSAEGRAVFEHLARALREGFNPGGSPTAVLAARRLPPSLHAEAARLLARENGLSKPAESFLQALELRATLHEAFNPTSRSP